MKDSTGRESSRLMKKHQIFFTSYKEDISYPSEYREIFKDIRQLGGYQFSSYTAAIDIRSKDEPWRKQTKSRVKWLSRRASELKGQKRNEAGWRLTLENHILHRLQVEVACSKCRSRLWRSEIEPKIEGDLILEGNLAKRRDKRTACSCPPDDRMWDILDTGQSSLFEDKIEEFVLQELIEEPILASEKHERSRKPDRVYGLRETNNFEKILDQVPSQSLDRSAAIRDFIKITPFMDTKEPVLFPFLLLEAKSESSNDGFNDIELQSAFSIKALLALQFKLRQRAASTPTCGSLVWFLAQRGDNWRVYGCYVTEKDPPSYEILLLYNGSLLLEDEALRLILILDYIVDWARDIYRPSILRQLKSIATGTAYDMVSLVSDSDVQSFRKPMYNWIPPVPSNFDERAQQMESDIPSSHLEAPILQGNRGVIRNSNLVTKKLAGLCLWEANISQFFHVINGGLSKTPEGQTAARDIKKLFSLEQRQKSSLKNGDRYGIIREQNLQERTLCLTGSELQVLEEAWMGETQHADDFSAIPPNERFFCFISFECYLTSSWEVVKQISYFAITMPALNHVMEFTNYKSGRSYLPLSLDYWESNIGDKALQDCLNCLSSASSTQGLLAAINAKSLTICCRPRKIFLTDSDHIYPEDQNCLLDFDMDYSWNQGEIVHKYVKTLQRAKMEYRRVHDLAMEHRNMIEEQLYSSLQNEFSSCRLGIRNDTIPNVKGHIPTACSRCCQSSARNLHIYHEPWNDGYIQSMNGMTLVYAPDCAQHVFAKDLGEKNICLFVQPQHLSSNAMSLMEGTLQNMIAAGEMYHSIRSPKRGCRNRLNIDQWPYIMWNIPVSYRENFPWETDEIKDWLTEQRKGQTVANTRKWDSYRKESLLKVYEGIIVHGKPYTEIHSQILLDLDKGTRPSSNFLSPLLESQISSKPKNSRKRSQNSPSASSRENDLESQQDQGARKTTLETCPPPLQKRRRQYQRSSHRTSVNDDTQTTDSLHTAESSSSSLFKATTQSSLTSRLTSPLPSSSNSPADHVFSHRIYTNRTAEELLEDEDEDLELAISLSLIESLTNGLDQKDDSGCNETRSTHEDRKKQDRKRRKERANR